MGRGKSKRRPSLGEPSLAVGEADRHQLQILRAASHRGLGEQTICTPAGTSQGYLGKINSADLALSRAGKRKQK